MRHGSPWTYRNHGCRCEPCKTAWSDYNRARRARRIAEGPNPQRHGVPSSYINHGCRCDECTAAIQNYRRQYRTRRKQEANRARRKAPAMTDWKDTAPCKGLSKLFFPAHNERPKAGVIREAKALAICARCPHRTPCKEIADTMSSEPRGIFGGVIYRDMTDRSRQQRKQKAMTA